MPIVKGPFDAGGVPPVGMTHPLGSRRRSGGRIGHALQAAASKPPAPVDKKQLAARALSRWENEGGRPAPRATSDPAKKIQAKPAPKTSVTKHSPKKAKPSPRAGKAKGGNKGAQ
jgi:hypothetical protein